MLCLSETRSKKRCSTLGALQLETMREDRTPLPPPKPVEKKSVSWNTPVASPCAEAVDGKLTLLTPSSTHTHPVDRKVTPRTHEGTPLDIRATSPSPVKTPIKAVDTNITPQIHLAAPSTKTVEVKTACETETKDTDDPDLSIPLSYFKISEEFQVDTNDRDVNITTARRTEKADKDTTFIVNISLGKRTEEDINKVNSRILSV